MSSYIYPGKPFPLPGLLPTELTRTVTSVLLMTHSRAFLGRKEGSTEENRASDQFQRAEEFVPL
jgi:hypothetical protein